MDLVPPTSQLSAESAVIVASCRQDRCHWCSESSPSERLSHKELILWFLATGQKWKRAVLDLETEQRPGGSRSNSAAHVSLLSGRRRVGPCNKEAAVLCHSEEPVTSPWLTQCQALTGQATPGPSPPKAGQETPGRLVEPDLNSPLVLDHDP